VIYELIIIGAGPAGMFAAGAASEKIKSVLILEKQPEPGRKLLLTGSGQCNFTNSVPGREFFSAFGENGGFLKPALQHFTNADAMAFFKKHGVEHMVVPETHKVFPRSRRAADILGVLRKRCQEQGVDLQCCRPVDRVKQGGDGVFWVYSGAQAYQSRRVLLATGGKSYPGTGSTGDGYALAASLGHTCVPPRPGLTSFIIRDFSLAALAGTSWKALPVTLWRLDKKIKTLVGDWLFTHQGVSGPVIQNLSRYALPGDQLRLALVPFEKIEIFRRDWETLLARSSKLTLKAWLKHFPVTQSFARFLMARAHVTAAETVAHLSREKREAFFEWLTAFPLTIQRLGDFNTAMVTCGGVSLAEINPKTMESRLVPGLYFAGELMDVDGDCGGFDLQAAWSTAALAAVSMGRSQT